MSDIKADAINAVLQLTDAECEQLFMELMRELDPDQRAAYMERLRGLAQAENRVERKGNAKEGGK